MIFNLKTSFYGIGKHTTATGFPIGISPASAFSFGMAQGSSSLSLATGRLELKERISRSVARMEVWSWDLQTLFCDIGYVLTGQASVHLQTQPVR